jgi:hypothetical protein
MSSTIEEAKRVEPAIKKIANCELAGRMLTGYLTYLLPENSQIRYVATVLQTRGPLRHFEIHSLHFYFFKKFDSQEFQKLKKAVKRFAESVGYYSIDETCIDMIAISFPSPSTEAAPPIQIYTFGFQVPMEIFKKEEISKPYKSLIDDLFYGTWKTWLEE